MTDTSHKMDLERVPIYKDPATGGYQLFLTLEREQIEALHGWTEWALGSSSVERAGIIVSTPDSRIEE